MESTLASTTTPLVMPRHGVLALGTALAKAGHAVSIFVECLNGINLEGVATADIVGFAVTYSNLKPVLAMAQKVRTINPRATLLAGGPHATISPTDVLEFADIAVRDEGQATTVALLERLSSGASLEGLPGISYRRNGRTIHAPRGSYLQDDSALEDLTLLSNFSLESRRLRLTAGEALCCYTTASRGCPFPCTFCYENMIGGTGFRTRAVDSLIEDIRAKKAFFGTNRFWFADSNFTTNEKYAEEVLQALIKADLGCAFNILCRVDIGTRPRLLGLMRDAGVESLSVGMESIEDERLASIEKRQTVAGIIATIDEIHCRGIRIFGLFMLGFDGDTARTPWQFTAFCKKHGVEDISIYCLGEYQNLPGRTLPRYRICELNTDYYNGHYVTTFPRNERPSAMERGVFESLLDFYSPRRPDLIGVDHHKGRLERGTLYLQWRKMNRVSVRHQRELAEIEAPYYDENNVLRENYLRAHPVIRHALPEDVLADWKDPSE
jgi:radical SAM superfamily enzyme YgiQ (UPF0313 family)